MAIGKASDMKVYDPRIQGGFIETLVQNTNVFNEASRGAIRLSNNFQSGDYNYEALFSNISNLISRRDNTSVSAATDLALSQAEEAAVKLNWKLGPVANTLDSFRKARGGTFNEDEFMFVVGQMAAKAAMVKQTNDAALAARAALNAQSDNKHTVASSGTMETSDLVDGLSKFGDAADRVEIWLMHSKVYFDLVKSQIAANIDGVSNFNVAQGSPVTLNRPVLITDSDSLKVASGSPLVTDYYTLGLTADAVNVETSEGEIIHGEIVTGLENLAYRIQGEGAYTLGVKGFTWDVANGGANPNSTALGTGSNWDKVLSDKRDLAGVIIQSR